MTDQLLSEVKKLHKEHSEYRGKRLKEIKNESLAGKLGVFQ